MIDFRKRDAAPYGWTKEFDGRLRKTLLSGDDDALIDFRSLPGGNLAVPTLDPMIYALGMKRPGNRWSSSMKGSRTYPSRCALS